MRESVQKRIRRPVEVGLGSFCNKGKSLIEKLSRYFIKSEIIVTRNKYHLLCLYVFFNFLLLFSERSRVGELIGKKEI